MTKIQYGVPFAVTHTHATAPTATKAAVSGKVHYITSVTVSSDKAGSIGIIKDGTTAIWQFQVGAGVHTVNLNFPLVGSENSAVTATIDSTSAGYANISGYTVSVAK